MRLTKGNTYDTAKLKCEGWTSTTSETAHDGYSAWDYFTQDGVYLGADEFGIEPLFAEVN